MRDYRKPQLIQRLHSDILYFRRNGYGDIFAAIATAAIIVLAPIVLALGR